MFSSLSIDVLTTLGLLLFRTVNTCDEETKLDEDVPTGESERVDLLFNDLRI